MGSRECAQPVILRRLVYEKETVERVSSYGEFHPAGSIQPILSFRRIFTCLNTIRVFRAGDSDVTAIGYELIAAGVTPAGINGLGTGLATPIASINRSLN
jgi:hypothetical protein